ncbi:hypothetical protein GCM10028808_25200 [Spirosoma migulaei]
MATITLEIDNKKLKFFKDLIKHFSFVRVQETELNEDTDEEVITNIRRGVKEMRQVEKGKQPSRPARDFLTEL